MNISLTITVFLDAPLYTKSYSFDLKKGDTLKSVTDFCVTKVYELLNKPLPEYCDFHNEFMCLDFSLDASVIKDEYLENFNMLDLLDFVNLDTKSLTENDITILYLICNQDFAKLNEVITECKEIKSVKDIMLEFMQKYFNRSDIKLIEYLDEPKVVQTHLKEAIGNMYILPDNVIFVE